MDKSADILTQEKNKKSADLQHRPFETKSKSWREQARAAGLAWFLHLLVQIGSGCTVHANFLPFLQPNYELPEFVWHRTVCLESVFECPYCSIMNTGRLQFDLEASHPDFSGKGDHIR